MATLLERLEGKRVFNQTISKFGSGGNESTAANRPSPEQRLHVLDPYLSVCTVDSVLGAQADVVYVSCVRTTRTGFASDIRRMNVALTRAKQQLVVVGCARTFAKRGDAELWPGVVAAGLRAQPKEKAQAHRVTPSVLCRLCLDARLAGGKRFKGGRCRHGKT